MEIRKQVIKKVHVEGFNEWMLKIKNVHYADNKQMTKAYERVCDSKKETPSTDIEPRYLRAI